MRVNVPDITSLKINGAERTTWTAAVRGCSKLVAHSQLLAFSYNTESRELMKNQYNIHPFHKVSSFIKYRKSGITQCLEKLTKSTKGHNRTLTDFITGDHLAAQE
jgi:hypothetical protein